MNKVAPLLRRYWYIFLILSLLAGLYWWFAKRLHSPLDAVPAQSVLVLECKGLVKAAQLLAQHPDPEWKSVVQHTILEASWQDAALAERLFRHDESIHGAFAANFMAAALSLNPADSLHPLLAVDLGRHVDLEKVLQANALSQKFFPSYFHGHTLYTVHLSKKERLVVAHTRNLLLCSRFSYLIEDALTQLEKGDNWWADNAWKGQVDDNAPIKLSFRPQTGILAMFLEQNWRFWPGLLEQNLRWAGISWDGQQTRGALKTAGSLESVGRNARSVSDELFSICPENTAMMAAVGVAKKEVFADWFRENNSDFKQYIYPWLGAEAAFVLTEPFSPDLREEQYWVLQIADSMGVGQKLDAYGAQRGLLRQYDYQTFSIRHFLSNAAFRPLLPGEGTALVNPACVVVGKYLVVAPSAAALELWIDKYIVSQTLGNSPGFLLQRQQMKTEGGISLFLNSQYLPAIAKRMLAEKPLTNSAESIALWARTGMVALDLAPAQNAGWMTATPASQQATELPATATGTSILWKTPLAAPAASAPCVVTRPADRETFICIQDSQQQLYCLRSNGSIAWRRQFDKKILSTIQGIDFQANGSVCFLFNTASHIWLLDEEGHDLEGFPLRLQSPATNGLTVVDFDENRKYSFFVACANGNIYGFDQFARPLPGWNPQSGVGRVEQPMLHFQREDKDFLVALSRGGRLSVFGRDGTMRFAPVQLEGTFAGPLQADATSRAPRIVCANTAGKVFVCGLDGQVFSLALPAAGAGKGKAYLVFAPLGGDNRLDYALLKGTVLSTSAYQEGSLRALGQLRLETAPDSLFAASDNHVGVLVRAKRQVYLADASGKIHPDFPLAGDTPFAFGQWFAGRREKVLLVGNGASIYAYKVQ